MFSLASLHTRLWLIISLLFFMPSLTFGQAIFNMSNATVSDCDGILLDSDAGIPTGNYDHDENFTFTICVPGASSITLSFSSFCTEADYDSLRIFDGADTFAVQLGPAYTGINIPATVTSTGPCLTINFISDANVTCTGWVAQWDTQIEEPILPTMTLGNPMPTCSTNQVTVNFDFPIPCDSINAGAFTVNGPAGSNVTSATPINCVNDSTTQASLTLNPGLNESGYYIFTYSSFFLDQCDSLWTLTTSDTLSVNDCPLDVYLTAVSDTICEGSCTDLLAHPSGGDFLSYNYSWTPGLPSIAGPHTVCPTTTTTYSVTVSDANGSTPATASITITVLPAPIMPPNLVLCLTDPLDTLMATPAGGWWTGPGITDGSLGEFDPEDAGPGIHTITYYGPNGCPSDMQISIKNIDAGPPQAACPGSLPFPASGFAPFFGGTWSGPNITPNGTITPTATPTTFTVTYTANGCSDTKTIYIGNPVVNTIDTVCESLDPFLLTATPPGGTWSGTGVQNLFTGEFDPVAAGPGSHSITYSISGCFQTFDIFVKEISIGDYITACPSQSPITLDPPNPPGGIWSSFFGGIIDPVAGIYDPSVLGVTNFNDTLTYIVDGCEASKIAYVRQTDIPIDSLSFCREDPVFLLDWTNLMRTPWDGIWVGNGIIDPDYPGEFDPFTAGPGNHKLVYTANTCADSMIMVVHPPAIPTDTSVCALAQPFTLPTNPPGGKWYGAGINDSTTGVFDTQVAGIGFHKVFYLSPFGCLDSATIEVYALPVISIDNLEAQYCYKDSVYQLQANPPGGIFSGPGIVGNTFSPALAGVGGPYLIEYTYGVGDCQQMAVGITNVSPELELSVNMAADTICPGEFVTLSATASVGATGAFLYTWDQGLGNGQSHTVNPATTTTYTVIASDGCSDQKLDQITIVVNPAFTLDFSNSDRICFGEEGYAVALVEGPNLYSIEWNTSPVQTGDTLFAPTGFNYQATVTDLLTDCQLVGTTEIPRFPYVNAAFLANPNDQCQTTLDRTFSFIDQSAGANQGYWDFGDGTIEPYILGTNPSHVYDNIGEYLVKLVLDNDGGCADSSETTVCVVPEESQLYIPNAFTPNGDNVNDFFQIESAGLTTFRIQIFDRWGTVIFESSQPDFQWDGYYRGKELPEGVYTYYITGYIIANNPRTNFRPVPIYEPGTITLIR